MPDDDNQNQKFPSTDNVLNAAKLSAPSPFSMAAETEPAGNQEPEPTIDDFVALSDRVAALERALMTASARKVTPDDESSLLARIEALEADLVWLRSKYGWPENEGIE